MRKIIFVLLSIAIISFIVTIYPPNPTISDKKVAQVGSFEECVKEGNPVLESYPPSCRTKEGILLTQNVGNESTLKDKIRIENPRPTAKIKSPLKITGEARGNWFFEAQFSAKLLNEDGEIIGQGIMTADGGWMTEEFVPFAGEIDFIVGKNKNGKLILEKANPSGLVEHNETLIVPVTFR